MAAFDPIVPPLTIDMRDALKRWVVTSIFIPDHLAIRRCLVGANRDGPVQADALDSLA